MYWKNFGVGLLVIALSPLWMPAVLIVSGCLQIADLIATLGAMVRDSNK